MSDGFWQGQRQAAWNDLMDTGAQMGANWRAKKEQEAFDKNLRIEYARALEAAKTTGVMPAHLQGTVTVDALGEQTGIKVVALRELGKRAPAHPLVVSPECRESVATVTKIQYNRKNRPTDQPLDDFAPDETVCERIFNAYGS